MADGVFTIKARRCKRCGRLLTSAKAVEEGYGESCRCKIKKEDKEKEPIPGQLNIFDMNQEEQGDD